MLRAAISPAEVAELNAQIDALNPAHGQAMGLTHAEAKCMMSDPHNPAGKEVQQGFGTPAGGVGLGSHPCFDVLIDHPSWIHHIKDFTDGAGTRLKSRSLSTPAAARNENRCYRSPTRSAIAQMERYPSVDITDTTPAHTAATLRPDRHHTHGHQVAIVGWRLYEPYGRIAFVAISSPTAHNQAETSQLCTLHMCLRAQFQSHAAGKPTAGGVRDKSSRSCLHFPTTPAGEGG